MGKMKRTVFDESARDNTHQYLQYIDRLTELAISMFDWKNLPDTVDERYLELILFEFGNCVFFEDKTLGCLALRSVNSGGFDVYGIPIYRRGIGRNGYNSPRLTTKNSVLIYNNYLHTNTFPMVETFAKRLYEIDRIIEVNARAQKTPVLVRASEKQRLTMLQVYKAYDGNEPVVFGDKDLDLNNLTVLSTEAPYVADKLYDLKTQYWHEILTYLGITSMPFQKKERMIQDEMISSQGGNMASRNSRLEARKHACDTINKMFGLNIDVEYRQDVRIFETEDLIKDKESEGENE